MQPIAVAARSKAWVCGRSLTGIVGSNPAGSCMSVCLLWVLCFVSALGWSLIQRSPTAYGVSECDNDASIMRRPWPTRGCCAMEKKKAGPRTAGNGLHPPALCLATSYQPRVQTGISWRGRTSERTEMALETLVYPRFNYLSQLLAREYFIEYL
jgi:hypothetical protein